MDRPIVPKVIRRVGDLRGVIDELPRLGREAKNFEKDIKEIIAHQPRLPHRNQWGRKSSFRKF